MDRFFAENLSESDLALSAGEAHHATHVLRLRPGAEVELFDGTGRTAAGRIAKAARREVVVRVERVSPPAPRPRPIVHLAFAVPKGKRLDWLLEKATELAAASLWPVKFKRSIAGGELTDAKRRRWQACCVSAAKQCGLNFLPEIRRPVGLDEFLAEMRGRESLILLRGDNSPAASGIVDALATSRGSSQSAIGNWQLEIVLLVGPEGGLTDGEKRACVEAGFRPVRIAQTTLRIETAAVALLAAMAILGQAGG